MASRPAPRRASGPGLTGLHYGLISFVIISVASLGGFIWQLTRVKALESEAQVATKRLREQGSAPDYYVNEAANRGSTAIDVLDDDRKKLAQLVTGTPDAYARNVEADVATLLTNVDATNKHTINKSDTLVTVIRKLDQALTKARREASERTNDVSNLQAENQALAESIKKVKDDFEGQVKAMNDQIATMQARVAKYQEEKDAQLAQIQELATRGSAELENERQKMLRERKNMEIEISRLNAQNSSLRKQMEEIKPTSFDPQAILTKADGRVIRAIPGSDVVYISLGEEDNIKLGMGFEIFSPTRDAKDSLRGKASIEVVALQQSTAECRVTRVEPGRPIIENDVIVNIAYERNRKPAFVIVGGFDLDFDGAPDFDGVEKIKGIIAEWGGQVVTEMDAMTDFVVVGARPIVPPAITNPTETVAAQIREKQQELANYNALLDAARVNFKPLVSQNQFLYLTGYAGDMRLASR